MIITTALLFSQMIPTCDKAKKYYKTDCCGRNSNASFYNGNYQR